jgi:hypothetical protein
LRSKRWWIHLTLSVYLFSLICRQDAGSTLVVR